MIVEKDFFEKGKKGKKTVYESKDIIEINMLVIIDKKAVRDKDKQNN